VRPPPPLQHHAGHCDDILGAVGVHGDKTSPRPPLCHVRAPVDGTLEVGPWTAAGRSTTTSPPSKPLLCGHKTRHDWNEIRQDGRQLHGTARHASTHRRIVRHACKSPSPWPIKGRAIPQPQGTTGDDEERSPTRSPPSPRYWHSPQSIPLGLGGQASSPTTLVAPLYEHYGAKQYSAPSTPLLDVRPRPEPG
jgi:hypothetical protein